MSGETVNLVCGDGIGGLLQGFVCADFIYNSGGYPRTFICARDEVFKPLNFLLKDKFLLEQLPEDWFDKFITDDTFFKDKIRDGYLNCPDMLFKHPRAFDYKRFNTNPSLIKSTRILTHKAKPENIVYLALNTSTPIYQYFRIRELILFLAARLPNHIIYFNNITKWAGKRIGNGEFSGLPNNVLYFEDQPFEESLEYLFRSCYCIVLDCGIMHIAQHLGTPKTIISNRLGPDGAMWRARWYYDCNEAISYNYTPRDIAYLVAKNIEIPQTTLISRKEIIENLEKDWRKELYFKY